MSCLKCAAFVCLPFVQGTAECSGTVFPHVLSCSSFFIPLFFVAVWYTLNAGTPPVKGGLAPQGLQMARRKCQLPPWRTPTPSQGLASCRCPVPGMPPRACRSKMLPASHLQGPVAGRLATENTTEPKRAARCLHLRSLHMVFA